ncbi:MAG: hypothetical protein IKM65_02240 [Bacteroidaceae bacterium]|nr:hypothetical protein [Alistipes sp.]MBR3854957.1 hypothetical protein [Bacteroidaceae bacterium]
MKKIIVLLVSVFAINTFNAFATNNKTTVETQTESDFYTCHFSLNHYSGTTHSDGDTNKVTVRLNCPQEKDVYATVYVYIDGECVVSKLFKIAAGKTESDSLNISTDYRGAKYTLKVQ